MHILYKRHSVLVIIVIVRHCTNLNTLLLISSYDFHSPSIVFVPKQQLLACDMS